MNYFENLLVAIIESKRYVPLLFNLTYSERIIVDLKPIPESIQLPDDTVVAEQAMKILSLETRLSS